MAALPLVTRDLVARLTHCNAGFLTTWLGSLHRLPGDPHGVRIERFGGATAIAVPGAPQVGWMQTVVGLTAGDLDRLDDIVDHYRSLGLSPRFEVAPLEGHERVGAALARVGAAPTQTYAVLYGLPVALPSPPADPRLRVRGVGPDGMGDFVETWMRGFGVAGRDRSVLEPSIAAWPRHEGWRPFLARWEGAPAAAGLLVAAGEIGFLTSAATVPELRRRGCQAALVAARTAAAAEDGCGLLGTLTEFAGASQRTMERAGLRLAFLMHAWALPVPAGLPAG